MLFRSGEVSLFLECGDLPTTPLGTKGRPQINVRLLAQLLSRIGGNNPAANLFAVVEQVQAMPKQGSSSGFRFGASFGIILGVLGALEIPYVLVHPSKWKKAMGLDANKDKARTMAIQRWPGASSYLTRKKDSGRAESLLLALYQFYRIHTMSDNKPVTP